MNKSLATCLIFILALLLPLQAQEQNPPKTKATQEDTLSIDTDLVQTGVSVVDKQGRFVDGLRSEEFQLSVDGKPMPVEFFERVTGGTVKDSSAVAAARTNAPSATAGPAAVTRGRSIVFFLDDYHLSSGSVERTRQLLLQFIDKQMDWSDQIAIVTATGQIGFLQQFSDNKAVLRAAIGRVTYRPYVVRDNENISMTEYQAVKISAGDKDALDFFVTELLKANNYSSTGGAMGPPRGGPALSSAGTDERTRTNGLSRPAAEGQVKTRANLVVKQSVAISQNTLGTLDAFMRQTARMPGRKLLFLVSDGFYMVDRASGTTEALRRIADAANRAGVVIYSLDARGMMTTADAASNQADPMGRLSRSNIGEVTASQDALSALADDTGGRAVFNNTAFESAITDALKETSNYYVLAWRPASDSQKSAKYRKVEVSVTGHPEYVVRVPRGIMDLTPAPDAKTANASTTSGSTTAARTPDTDLRGALSAFAPLRQLPTRVAASYVDTPEHGTVLTASVQVKAGALNYGAGGKDAAAIDFAGVVLNDQGKTVSSFKTRLNVDPTFVESTGSDNVIYNYRAILQPGIYQVRMAARDSKSELMGSGVQWIEIPDLKSTGLALSSLLVEGPSIAGKNDAQAELQLSVDRQFKRAAHLVFWMFVYNASRGGSLQPSLTGQVQIFQDGRSIVSTPQGNIATTGNADMARIPYGGNFALAGLTPGRYRLQVTITDQQAHKSASQSVFFEVE